MLMLHQIMEIMVYWTKEKVSVNDMHTTIQKWLDCTINKSYIVHPHHSKTQEEK